MQNKQLSTEHWMLQSNQNQAMIAKDGICYTLTASMGMGGGYVPMIVEIKDAAAPFYIDKSKLTRYNKRVLINEEE